MLNDQVGLLLKAQQHVLKAELRALEAQRIENEGLEKQLKSRRSRDSVSVGSSSVGNSNRQSSAQTQKLSPTGNNGRLFCSCRFGTISENVLAVHKSRCRLCASQNSVVVPSAAPSSDSTEADSSASSAKKQKISAPPTPESHQPNSPPLTHHPSLLSTTSFQSISTSSHSFPITSSLPLIDLRDINGKLNLTNFPQLSSSMSLLPPTAQLCSRVLCTDQIDGSQHCWVAITEEQFTKYGFCWKCRWCGKICTFTSSSSDTELVVVLSNLQQRMQQYQISGHGFNDEAYYSSYRWAECDDPSSPQRLNTDKLIICTVKPTGLKNDESSSNSEFTSTKHAESIADLTREQMISVLISCYSFLSKDDADQILCASKMNLFTALTSLDALEVYPKCILKNLAHQPTHTEAPSQQSYGYV